MGFTGIRAASRGWADTEREGDPIMNKFLRMAIGLTYIQKAEQAMVAMPRSFWPTPEVMADRERALLRARVLFEIGARLYDGAVAASPDPVPAADPALAAA